jgi:hypothetical protein
MTDVSEVLTASIRAIVLMMETISTSETSVNFYQTTQSNTLQDSDIQLNPFNIFRPVISKVNFNT